MKKREGKEKLWREEKGRRRCEDKRREGENVKIREGKEKM